MTPQQESLHQRLGFALPPAMAPTLQNQEKQRSQLLKALLYELGGSIHDYDVVARKCNFHRNSDYKMLLESLTSDEYGQILHKTTMCHQVQVALMLAKILRKKQQRGSNHSGLFTCQHVVSAIRQVSEYFRPNLVETLLPYCHDLSEHRKLIQDELTEWEQILTAKAFDRAAAR